MKLTKAKSGAFKIVATDMNLLPPSPKGEFAKRLWLLVGPLQNPPLGDGGNKSDNFKCTHIAF